MSGQPVQIVINQGHGGPQQQQMGGYPPQQGYPSQQQAPMSYGAPHPGAMTYTVNMDPWFHLAQMGKPQIKEKVNLMEVFFDVDMANKYDIFDDHGAKVFFAGETTGCCERNCIPKDCRPFSLLMSMQQFPGMPKPQPFLRAKKETQCTCFCLNRPLMVVDDNNGNKFGEIVNPFNCFDMNFIVRDHAGTDVLRVHGSCCQPGFFCQCPCGPCKEIHFEIEDIKTKEKVGHLIHKIPGCLKFLATEADNYDVEFGKITDSKWKAMILATAIFIDFRYFTQNKDNSTSHGGDF